MVGLILSAIVSVIVGSIAFLWANEIDKMKNEHPDYKGEDFLNWDDNKIHSEDKI